jgi:hypothetical protein
MKMSVALLRKIIKEELELMAEASRVGLDRVILSPEEADRLRHPEEASEEIADEPVSEPAPKLSRAPHPGTGRIHLSPEEAAELRRLAGLGL